MKIYAIGYQEHVNDNGETVMKFEIYTDKFLSTRQYISKDFYEELKKIFKIACNKNSYKSGMYFDTI